MGKRPDTLEFAIERHAASRPRHPAIVTRNGSLTYAELWSSARAAAAALSLGGVRRGDRVLLSAPSDQLAFFSGYLGAHLCGAAAMPVDSRATADQLNAIVALATPRAAYLVGPAVDGVTLAAPLGDLEAADEPASDETYWAGSDEIADVIFTTGTTGVPKGVALSHGAILSAARHISGFVGNGAEDREIMPLPLHHSFGLGRLRCSLLAGGTLICLNGFTFPGAIVKAVERHQATGFASVPAGLAVLIKLGDSVLERLGRYLRYIEIGSAAMPLEHKEKLMATWPQTRLCMHYGLTEASRSAFIEFHASRDKLTSIGRAAPGVELRIADEQMADLSAGETGRVVVRGPHTMSGYLEAGELQAPESVDGWLVTGDLGYVDEEGFVFLAGREGDLINVGGRKVSPEEVEACLSRIPAVAECACVGVPDPNGITGEIISAYVVLDASGDPLDIASLEAHAARHLPAYKRPTEYFFVAALPRSDSGKLRRAALRADRSG